MGFRYRRGLGLSYQRQGLIYFTSRTYAEQPKRVRDKIEQLCRDCGGAYWAALFEFVTSDAGAVSICGRHHISQATLYRAVQAYYREWID